MFGPKCNGAGPAQITTSTVTLTPSYSHIAAGADHALDDYALCRSFTWSDGKPALQSISCYAVPAFAVTELANRDFVASALSNLKVPNAGDFHPYWPEAELRIQKVPADRLVVHGVNDNIEYQLDAEVVVHMAGSASKLRDDESIRVARYFARHWPLHPQPRRDLR